MNTTKTIKTRIESSKYRATIGRQPQGRGFWGFHPDFSVSGASKEIFWFSGIFVDAKRAAIAHFSAQGVAVVQVLS